MLDNAETCIDAAADLVVKWRALAPKTKLLVTSREPLGVLGEHVVDVPPLALPSAGDDPLRFDAVQLLLDRARAVRADFDAPAEVLADIVHRTEGIPLAIELAAARLDVLTVSSGSGGQRSTLRCSRWRQW